MKKLKLEILLLLINTVTLDDIENFAELSGINSIHMDENSLDGTIFTERVAHGYFIMSKYGEDCLVDPPKGPVLLNYGIDECDYRKPVYPGMTVGVRLPTLIRKK